MAAGSAISTIAKKFVTTGFNAFGSWLLASGQDAARQCQEPRAKSQELFQAWRRFSLALRGLALLSLAILASRHTAAEEPAGNSEATVLIGPRRDGAAASSPAIGVRVREWFREGLSDSAYQAEAAEAAALLGRDKLSYEEKTALSDAIRRDRERSGRAFGACLDWHQYDAVTRLGATRGIAMAAAASQTTRKPLANVLLAEQAPQVRQAALELVRERKDSAVTAEVLRYWREAYDDTLGFDEAKRAAAVAAMRDLGDRKAYQALYYLVTLEMYAGAATAPAITEVNIQGPGINLPIQLPGIDLISFRGTVIVPAFASLKGVTRQDFGHDLAKWREWINKQPDFSK